MSSAQKTMQGWYICKTDPNNNCKFEDCGGSNNPTPTPDVGIDNPMMKFRWAKVDDYSILQIKNLPNPLDGSINTNYRMCMDQMF